MSRLDPLTSSEYQLLHHVSMESAVNVVANHFNVSPGEILRGKRGAGKTNLPRRIAMYLCHRQTGSTLAQIAQYFNVTHYSTVSQTVRRLLKDNEGNLKFEKILNVLCQDLTL